MTYRQLLEQLEDLRDEQLDQTVTVHEPYEDEYIAVAHTATTNDVGALDEDHFYLVLKA